MFSCDIRYSFQGGWYKIKHLSNLKFSIPFFFNKKKRLRTSSSRAEASFEEFASTGFFCKSRCVWSNSTWQFSGVRKIGDWENNTEVAAIFSEDKSHVLISLITPEINIPTVVARCLFLQKRKVLQYCWINESRQHTITASLAFFRYRMILTVPLLTWFMKVQPGCCLPYI